MNKGSYYICTAEKLMLGEFSAAFEIVKEAVGEDKYMVWYRIPINRSLIVQICQRL